MRECNTYQCLLFRDQSWNPPQHLLEDFEKEGQFVLSGLSGFMEAGGNLVTRVFPRRNNVSYPQTELEVDVHFDGLSGMPFHPTCFEIFKRASMYRYGFINVEALATWAPQKDEPEMQIPKHEAVAKITDNNWQHNVGDEFLAANPCFVPGLQYILDSVQNTSDPDQSCSDEAMPAPHATDFFSKLPQEIKLDILLQLDSWDIANLRLSSRAFRHLPQSLFYHLTLRELPWLYEAWTSAPLSFFVTTTAAEQEDIEVTLSDIRHDFLKAHDRDDGSNEAAEEIQRLVRLAAELEKRQNERPITPVTMLDRRRTNWTRLRGELIRHWGELPGLRNRRRIWNSCQDIMDRAEFIRDKTETDDE
ncbi:hypothetical protein IL306_008735 [Fusarium sp. DS 682]|nr:hypothetical protein IL306_008735 [Fusarium sp. DS 682]